MEIKGTVKSVGNTVDVTSSFKKRELVVTTQEQYPQHILIEFVQDRTSLLDSVSKGDEVTVGINIRGREWTSPQGEVKYFNSIHGWRIEKTGEGQVDNSSTVAPNVSNDEDDDLPF